MGRLKIYDDAGKLQNFDPSGNMTVTDNDTQHNTLSVKEIVGGIIVHTSASNHGTVTTDTAANIIAGYEGKGALQEIGDTIMCYYLNDGASAYDLTLSDGGSVTIADSTQKIGQQESVIILFRKTGAAAVTCYTIGGRA